jgi:transposase
MKFEEVYDRTVGGVLSVAEAAEILGMSERNFRRWRDRFEAEGADGLYDRRLGRVSARRAAVDEVGGGVGAVRHALLRFHGEALS